MKTSFLFLAVLILGGCNQTTYRTYGEKPLESSGEGVVQYTVSKAFYRMVPDCVVVLPAIGDAKVKDKNLVERAAARHLRGKFERVIGPDERRSLVRRLALDLSNAVDRRYFANYRHKGRNCQYFARPSILGIEENFALIWAGRRVHLGLEIVSGRTDASLWRSDHSTDRGDGGLPLSPLSLGSAAYRAGKLNADKDMVPSMIDDVFRRILKTLPDMRHF